MALRNAGEGFSKVTQMKSEAKFSVFYVCVTCLGCMVSSLQLMWESLLRLFPPSQRMICASHASNF